MEIKDLIDFGKRLRDKGRSPSDIRLALLSKCNNEKTVRKALVAVFEDEEKKSVSSVSTKEMLDANNARLNYLDSMHYSKKTAIITIIAGCIVRILSREPVNSYEFYSYFTIAQGIFILVIAYLLKSERNLKKLHQYAIIGFCSIFLLELILLGFPGDLYAGYDNYDVNPSPGSKLYISYDFARIFGAIFPFLYLFFKLGIGLYLVQRYVSYLKFLRIPENVQKELKNWN